MSKLNEDGLVAGQLVDEKTWRKVINETKANKEVKRVYKRKTAPTKDEE